MRILHLVSYSLYSGPLPSTLGLALAQRAAGHQVWLAHDTRRGQINAFEEAADPWIEEAGLGLPSPLGLSAKSPPLEFIRDVFGLRGFVATGEIDVVHVHLSHDHTLAALALPKKWGGALIRTIHSERSLAGRFGQGWLNRRAAGFVVRCDEHRTTLTGQLLSSGGTPPPIGTIFGGIDSRRFKPASTVERWEARARLQLPAEAPLIGHVALISGRGQEELVDALSILASSGEEETHLVFVGRGEKEDALRAHVRDSAVAHRVHFTGYLQGEELQVGYAALDAAFCAQPGNDASARAVLEAMSSGLPPLAIQVGALAETVSVEVGYPIPVRTPSAIAEGIKRWRQDPEEAKRRGARAREQVVAHRSFEAEARETEALYQECRSRMGS